PAVPAVTVPHEKSPALFDDPTARYGPSATPETVNVLPPEAGVAVTPTAGNEVLHALMAAAMFAASAAVLIPLAKVPVVELVQPLVGGKPVVTALQTKLLAFPPSVRVLAGLPRVVLPTVTTAPVEAAVTPTAGYAVLQALMALAKLVAAVDGMELTIKVPVVALVHPFVPVV